MSMSTDLRLKNNSRRDLAIEFARIVACFMVVCIHLGLPTEINGTLSKGALFLACLRADAVAIFWLVSGFHFFKKRPYKTTLKRMLVRIVVPMMVVFFVGFLFADWISGAETISQSVTHTRGEWADFFKGMLVEWIPPSTGGKHLWYLYVYIILTIMQPIGAAFVRSLDTPAKKKMALAVSAAVLALNDISGNVFGRFEHHVFRAAVPAFVIMLWGCLLYPEREQIMKRLRLPVCLVLFLGLNALRFVLLLWQHNHSESPNNALLYWYTVFGLGTAVAVFGICYHLVKTVSKVGTLAKGIRFIGACTFGVYLIHSLVIILLKRLGISVAVEGLANKSSRIAIRQCIYMILFGGIVMLTSLLFISIIKLIKRCIQLHSPSSKPL